MVKSILLYNCNEWTLIIKSKQKLQNNKLTISIRFTTQPLTLVRNLDVMYKATTSLKDHSYYMKLKLNNEEDLELLRNLLKGKVKQKGLVRRILKAGDVTLSLEEDAERQYVKSSLTHYPLGHQTSLKGHQFFDISATF